MPRISVIGGDIAIGVGHTPVLPVDTGGTPGKPIIKLDPLQVVGLLPLIPCDTCECRDICDDPCTYRNPVFGELVGGSYQTGMTYENDWSTFLIDISIFKTQPSSVNVTFELERYVFGKWQGTPFGANLNNNTFGQLYPLGSIIGHPTYAGYAVNWGAVLFTIGPGCYRFKVNTSFNGISTGPGSTGEPSPDIYVGCLVSPPLDLKKWDCPHAHGTVKFETWLTGLIGDPYTDYLKHDVCGVNWYDSIRLKGFFGYQKTPEYKTENLEWGDPQQGKIEHIRDEQLQRWEFRSKLLPEYIMTRFSTFAMMSDMLFASDYNYNNSDLTIKRKNVIKDSAFEPEYFDQGAYFTRKDKSKVQIFFKRGVQSVEKTICCPVR